MTCCMEKNVKGIMKKLFIYSEDERNFNITVSWGDKRYRRSGFVTWNDAYQRGLEMLEGV